MPELLPQPALGQLGERGRVLGARHQRLEDLPPRLAQDVGGDRGQLDVRPLQRLPQPVRLGRVLPDQRGAVSRQFPQLPLRPVGDEAPLQQPVAQQVVDPIGSCDGVLAAW